MVLVNTFVIVYSLILICYSLYFYIHVNNEVISPSSERSEELWTTCM